MLGCVQIDTINVVERSHYLVFWSRLGNYNKEFLDQLLYPDRKVFEYWAHAASIIPIEYYRYFIPAMKKRRQELQSKAKHWLKEKTGLLDIVLNEIKHNGPLSSKDFVYEEEGVNKRRGGWWDWKPAKFALELLYDAGVLMVSYRKKFQKYYDLTENVLPSYVDISEPTNEELQHFFVEKTLEAWGIAELKDFAQYFYKWSTSAGMGAKTVPLSLKELENQDLIVTVQVEDVGKPYYILTKDLETLRKIADSKDKKDNVSFIAPFDNLTWSKPRTPLLFDFHPVLETYIPKEKRKFGYYSLGILYGNKIVGRLDPKIHRDKTSLEIKAIELKEGFRITEDFKQKLALAIQDFMKFHNAKTLELAKKCSKNNRLFT